MVRSPPSASGSASAVRASSPVEDSRTRHGSSATSSGVVAAVAATPLEASRIVRRGVPCVLATSASSSPTRVRSRAGVVQDRGQLGDLGGERVALGLQLEGAEAGQPAQRHLEDVVGLQLAELERLAQPGAGHGGVVAAADDGDDVVDVEDGQEQALDQVQPLLGLARGRTRCAGG